MPLLARWVAELQVDLAAARVENAQLYERAQVAADIRWWIDRHTPNQVRDLAAALDEVA